ncbi:hypothetical protein Tcan_00720, partial [Toxocara canis]
MTGRSYNLVERHRCGRCISAANRLLNSTRTPLFAHFTTTSGTHQRTQTPFHFQTRQPISSSEPSNHSSYKITQSLSIKELFRVAASMISGSILLKLLIVYGMRVNGSIKAMQPTIQKSSKETPQ